MPNPLPRSQQQPTVLSVADLGEILRKRGPFEIQDRRTATWFHPAQAAPRIRQMYAIFSPLLGHLSEIQCPWAHA